MHAPASRWFSVNAERGWASCPITQNGCVRIMSHPSYPNSLKVGAIMERLGEAIATPPHEFWSDDISLLDSRIADRTRIHGPRQVTDLYLLALAVRNDGCFVSFDSTVVRSAIKDAEQRHLVTL